MIIPPVILVAAALAVGLIGHEARRRSNGHLIGAGRPWLLGRVG